MFEKKMEKDPSMSDDAKAWYSNIWFRRIVFITLAILCYPAMSFTIQTISAVSGLDTYNYGPYFILNEFTGPIVMMNFIFILFYIGLSMAFILKAFSISEEIPID